MTARVVLWPKQQCDGVVLTVAVHFVDMHAAESSVSTALSADLCVSQCL